MLRPIKTEMERMRMRLRAIVAEISRVDSGAAENMIRYRIKTSTSLNLRPNLAKRMKMPRLSHTHVTSDANQEQLWSSLGPSA